MNTLPQTRHREAAEQAVQLAMPMLEAARADRRVGESGFLHVVIMDPQARPADGDFESAILYEKSIGDTSRWDADYGAYARAKARLSWRTGRPSHEVLALQPHLVAQGDVLVWGSAVVDGVVVGVSGANPWFDEALSGAIAHLFKACVHAQVDAQASA